MNLVKIGCTFCGKEYFRQAGRVNEARKFGWNQYCAKECQRKAKTTKVEKVCGNPNCNNKVSRILHEFRNSKSGLIFCSHSCAAVVNNRKHPKRKRQIIINKQKIYINPGFIICAKCGKQFQGNGGKKYCSLKCKRAALQTYTPQQLIEIIRKKAYKLKRVPAKRELRKVSSCCVSVFGSWSNAVIAAGFQPNRSHDHRMYKRINTKAVDEHLCDSVSEAIIDNWLTENKIFHEKDVFYPKTNHKADWAIFIGNQKIFVEYFGLANDSPRYDRAIRRKKKLCEKYNIPLIEIYPQDLYPKQCLDEEMENKFRNFIGSKLLIQAARI